ncbi:hypothetical protein PHEL49_1948 [Polaribacter sp. Hel1_33_49]|nr:hypothetical protein PHEL49_1948 [Polaribacter sp. Hel1_33_49]
MSILIILLISKGFYFVLIEIHTIFKTTFFYQRQDVFSGYDFLN